MPRVAAVLSALDEDETLCAVVTEASSDTLYNSRRGARPDASRTSGSLLSA